MVLGPPLQFWLVSLLAFFIVAVRSQSKELQVMAQWRSLDFDFSSPKDRDDAIDEGVFLPGRIVPLDMAVYEQGNGVVIFVTIPRFQPGVPATLGYVTNKRDKNGDRLIAPYPNWLLQNPGINCSGIVSVYRIAVDSTGRLWVLDSGNVLDNKQICPPTLLVYTLSKNAPPKRYVFPKDQYTDASLFINLIVDERDNSDNVYVYIADVTGFALIVYDEENDRSWRIVNNIFYPDPDYGTFLINNESFDLMDGIFGLALGPLLSNGDRILYFHSLASRSEASVPTSVIRNYALFNGQPGASPRSFAFLEYRRSSQSAAEAMESNGVLFHSLLSDVSVGCWNINKLDRFGHPASDVIVRNRETLQFPSGMKVVKRRRTGSEELWIMTMRFQKVMAGTLNPNDTNFRIQRANIDDLVNGTNCESRRPNFEIACSPSIGNPN